MRSSVTAILRLSEAGVPATARAVEVALAPLRHVSDVFVVPESRTIAVRFDHGVAALGDIVRLIEDRGPAVTSITVRRSRLRLSSRRRVARLPYDGRNG